MMENRGRINSLLNQTFMSQIKNPTLTLTYTRWTSPMSKRFLFFLNILKEKTATLKKRTPPLSNARL